MRGCIVLSLNQRKKALLQSFYEHLFGNRPVFHGDTFSDKFSSDDSYENVKVAMGAFCLTDEKFFELPVPTQGSLVVSCFSGVIANEEELREFTNADPNAKEGTLPNKLLVMLNSSKHGAKPENSNYAEIIYDRVTSKIKGVWTMTLAYVSVSGRTRIAIAKKDRDIFFHFVMCDGFHALVWTDELDVFDELDNRYYLYSMTPLSHKDLLVIHPMYIIDKWKKWRTKYKNEQNQSELMSIAILEKYLNRIAR